MSSKGKRNAFSMISGSLDFPHHQDFCAEKLLFSFNIITIVPELEEGDERWKLRKGMAAVKNVHTINLNLIQIAFAIIASPIHNEKREK